MFDVEEGEHTFRDTKGQTRIGSRMIVPRFCVMDGEVIESSEAPALEQGNWFFMPRVPEDPAEGIDLDQEQRGFTAVLGKSVEHADWDDGLAMQQAYRAGVCRAMRARDAELVRHHAVKLRMRHSPGLGDEICRAVDRDRLLATSLDPSDARVVSGADAGEDNT